MKITAGTLWRGADTSIVNESGRTEFMRTAMSGNQGLQYTKMLAEFRDTDVNIRDKEGRTALHWVCALNSPMMVRLCLSIPSCDIGLRDNDGLTAFDFSLQNWNQSIQTIFYRSMIGVEERDPQAALLQVLTVTSDPAKDRPLIPGAAMFDSIQNFNTPLGKALITRGIDLTARNKEGDTALHVAVDAHHVEIITMLLEAGSDVNAIGGCGDTPLHYAARTSGEVVRAIPNYGADIEAANDSNLRALHLAAEREHAETAGGPLEHGALVEAVSYLGQTALHLAASTNRGDRPVKENRLAHGCRERTPGHSQRAPGWRSENQLPQSLGNAIATSFETRTQGDS